MSIIKTSENYIILNLIGKGAFGKVYKAQNKTTKEFVAIKIVSLEETNVMNIKDELEKEIKIMKTFNFCPNSVKLYDVFEDNNNKYIIMELCDGDLLKYLNKSKNGFNIMEIKIIMSQINNILKELRKKDMVHNDIRLENILVKFSENSKEFEVKLIDYGKGRLLSNEKDLSDNEWGITPYNEGKKENIEMLIKLDLLMIGIEIYRMIFNENYKAFEDMIEDINNSVADKDLKDLLNKLLVEDYEDRIDWEEYFNHNFFKGKNLEFSKVENIIKE